MWTNHHGRCMCLCLASGCHDNRYVCVHRESLVSYNHTAGTVTTHTGRVEFWFQSIPGHFIYGDGSLRWMCTIYFFFVHTTPQGFNIVWALFLNDWFILFLCVCFLTFFYEFFFPDWSIDPLWKSGVQSYSHQYILSVQQPFSIRFFTTVLYKHTQPISVLSRHFLSLSICFYTIMIIMSIHLPAFTQGFSGKILYHISFPLFTMLFVKTTPRLRTLKFFPPTQSKQSFHHQSWNVKSEHKILFSSGKSGRSVSCIMLQFFQVSFQEGVWTNWFFFFF